MNTIHSIYLAVKNGSRLEDVIPIGASLPHWEALLNNYKPDAPAKRKPAKRTSSGKTTRKSQKAAMENVTALATLTLVERVNTDRKQQIADLLEEIDADVRARLARRNAVYDAMISPDPLNCEPQRGGWMVKE